MTAFLAWLDQPFSIAEYAYLYLIGGMIVVFLTFAFGEGCALAVLFAAATLTWAASQGTALAYWQAGGFWLGWFSIVSVASAIYRRVRIRQWKRARAEIERARAEFARRGMDFDYEMAQAGLRIANRDWQRRCLGLDKE